MSEMSEDMMLTNQVVERLKLLANPNRLRIACRLMEGELSVGEIQDELSIRQPTLSREIARLRDGGVIKARRQSKTVFYTLVDADMARLIAAICQASHEAAEEAVHNPNPQPFTPAPQGTAPLQGQARGGFSLFPVLSASQHKKSEKGDPDDQT